MNTQTAWEKVKKFKRILRSKQNPQPRLNQEQEKEFHQYWKGMYKADHNPGLEAHHQGEGRIPDDEEIRNILRNVPNNKASGPD